MEAQVISGVALLVSVLSTVFAVLSWREAHRPILIARVTTGVSGNVATTLLLLVENTGNRPARDIALICDKRALERALAPRYRTTPPDDVRFAFNTGTVIPILKNGEARTCAFGLFSADDSTWIAGSRIPITILYKDIGRRRFSQRVTLLVADDHSFTGLQWGKA